MATLFVPSIGSTSQVQRPPPPSAPSTPDSSAMISWPGKASRIRPMINFWPARDEPVGGAEFVHIAVTLHLKDAVRGRVRRIDHPDVLVVHGAVQHVAGEVPAM